MEDHIDWQKFSRYLADECSTEERKEIESWIEADPLRREFVDSLRVIWEAADRKPAEWDVEAAWKIVVSRTRIGSLQAPNKSRVVRDKEGLWGFRHWSERSLAQYVRVAVAVLLLVGLPYLLFRFFVATPDASDRITMREVVTEKGERAKVKLTDGTTVLLNAASFIRFPEKFTGKTRELQLQGEAYFDVKPMEGIPFIVRVQEASVEVLGTKFSVRAWPDENRVQVFVADGSVAFRSPRGERAQHIVLGKGQMSDLKEDGILSHSTNVDPDKYLDWVSGRLVFENASFDEVLKRLERKYNLVCSVSDSSLLRRRLTASFTDEPVQDIVKIIALTLDLQYRQSNGTVMFYSVKLKGTRKRGIHYQ